MSEHTAPNEDTDDYFAGYAGDAEIARRERIRAAVAKAKGQV